MGYTHYFENRVDEEGFQNWTLDKNLLNKI